MVAFHQGAVILEHFAGEQIARGILPGDRKIEAPCQGADRWGRKLEAPCQGADSSEHLARGQIFKGISPGGRKIGTPLQGAYGWGHFTRGQIAWNTFPGGR